MPAAAGSDDRGGNKVRMIEAARDEQVGEPEVMAEGRFLRLMRRSVPNGHWEYVVRQGVDCAVVILALTDDGRVPLVRQFRPPVGREVWELPAGLVDRDEPLETTAVRELEEECGFTADHVEHLLTTPAAQASAGLMLEFYYLSGLREVPRPPGDEKFPLRCELVPVRELTSFLLDRAAAGELVDARVYAALHVALATGRVTL